MRKAIDWRSSLLFAIVGAVLGVIVDTLVRSSTQGFSVNWGNIVTSTIVGAILGWMFDLARGFQDVLYDALRQLETASRALKYQEQALDTLLRDKRHTNVLHELITDSVQVKFHHIPFVDINTYFNYLHLAIEQCNKFEGVHNRPVSFYKQVERGEEYLQKLRDRKMLLKRRIFIIDDEDENQMEKDLIDKDLMDFYWRNSGKDMETYWIRYRDFKKYFKTLSEVPADFGLYDNQLLIRYDSEHLVVTFDVIDGESNEQGVFDGLDKQMRGNMPVPFIKIHYRDPSRP